MNSEIYKKINKWSRDFGFILWATESDRLNLSYQNCSRIFFSLAIKFMLLYKEITQFAKSKIIESQLYIDFSLREEKQSMKYVEKNKQCIGQFLTQHENSRKFEPSINCKKKVKDNLPYRKVSLLSCTLHQVFTKPFYALF